eukprot:CAMPEP_0169272862 /NCGR_PEP_ID=MMETSP1016-20121227/50739_1 /TAXON_ID=342587 /ORGANISM="Karlodinium micrum, Strain CCMP2283" /LENGTH=99 /DNA_ID=CAMNT_0009359027 /DNA_START=1077 /DNA_END=1376 /DNA_ORIENTATION=+
MRTNFIARVLVPIAPEAPNSTILSIGKVEKKSIVNHEERYFFWIADGTVLVNPFSSTKAVRKHRIISMAKTASTKMSNITQPPLASTPKPIRYGMLSTL